MPFPAIVRFSLLALAILAGRWAARRGWLR